MSTMRIGSTMLIWLFMYRNGFNVRYPRPATLWSPPR